MPRLRSLLALCLLSAAAAAADWPQWLGPNRDGATTEKVAPWKDAPQVLWRQPVGEGHSSPVVAGGRVILHTKVRDKDREEVTAYDAKTGQLEWQNFNDKAPFKGIFGDGPRATPAVAGGRVYTFGITGVLCCWDADSGKLRWQVDTLKTFQAPNLKFGASCSPLVEGQAVLVNVGGKGASVVAFEKEKGEVVWKALDDPASYSSPVAFGQGKERQVVFLTQKGLRSLSPADGRVFWEVPYQDLLLESSATPVRAGDLLVGSSITLGSVGLTLAGKDGTPTAGKAWQNAALTSYFSTPVPVGKDHFYMVTGTNPLRLKKASADLCCVETATGKELWRQAKVGEYHASLMRTGDDKILMLDDLGHLVLLDPDPKGYRELARSKVCGKTWAHPALADGRLYVREDK
jgi:outer membrane protein assembly factor BamB